MRKEPIAIVGVSALFPGSEDEAGFWRDIVAGKDLITDVPAHRWLIEDHYDPDPRAEDKTYCKRGAFLSPHSFDPLEFGVPPNAIPATDTCQLLALVAAKRVLDDVARGQAGEVDRERASVILGVTSGQQLFLEVTSRLRRPIWVKALRESGIAESQVTEICDRIAASYVPWQENTFPGLLGNVVAGRIANRFDLHGTNCVTDAACASSLAAISMAVDELRLGRSDLVITGGADTFNDVSMFVAFSKTPALSPTGDCRPFSDRADGTVLGEGIAMFALKRLSDAERDGNHIYALIRAIGSSSDGRSKSIYAPLPSGQARAMKRAYEEAGYGPSSIDLVEAHGTGTAAGDAAEIESLRLVFEPEAGEQRQWCALGSVKSQVGHTKAAAGAAALFKTAMALHHQTLPPTIKVDRPSPALNLAESPFYLNTTARPWVPRQGHGRRASVSSFGFGGTNFHAVLEEYEGTNARPKRIWPNGPELVLLSAPDKGALSAACTETASRCAAEQVPFASIALATQLAFDAAAPQRIAAVASDRQEMAHKLRQLGEGKVPPGTHTGGKSVGGKIAFLFPGQGSQYLNMGAGLAMMFPEAMAIWEKAPSVASVVFPPRAFSREEDTEHSGKLTATEWAQPAVGAMSAALLALLDMLGVRPDCVGGHSFGEISALFAGGGMGLETMLDLARRRGDWMRACSTEPAGMLSVRSSWGRISGILDGLAVTPANHNGPAQVVLSGLAGPLGEAERRLLSKGFAVTALPVSTAFHSALMEPAAQAFEEYIRGLPIASPQLPFYSNLDGALHSPDGQAVATELAQQIAAPVLFGGMVERMYADGVRTFVEVGPRDVLTSLVGNILEGREHQAIALDRPGQAGLRAFWEGLGALSAAGVSMNWRRFRDGHAVSPDLSRPSQPKFSVSIDGGNYGRPYPPVGGSAALPAAVNNPVHESSSGEASSTQAYRIFQESITAAHQDWQTNLAKGHEAFLRSMEAALTGGLGTGAAPEPAPFQREAAVQAQRVIPAEHVRHEHAPSRSVLWEIVAEKTGYPADMLEPGMALEADLGIDSIKRVEIFSALQERFPALANMDQAGAASLRTLGDIITALDGTVSAAPSAPPAAVNSAHGVVWEVVAEKTGYPAEMLQPAMALEADLGIDSIKRVEIFSALQERFPALANMDQAGAASLRTLGDIVTALDGTVSASRSAPPVAVNSAQSLVWEVVAEKTGYPADMLQPAMALEADLGIDSIKRVEIFSALQERFPALANMDQAGAASLRTLGDIVTALDGTASAAPSAAPAARDSSQTLVWEVVAEKTGYPADMLQPAMALESDLGIDSIKRVEIFSALQERFPALANMDQAGAASLRTLGDIVTALDGSIEPQTPLPLLPKRYVVSRRPTPVSGDSMLRPGNRAVIHGDMGGDKRGVAAVLAGLLSARGFAASVGGDSPDATVWICLAGESWDAVRFAQAAAGRAATFITVQDARQPWAGGLSGLAKTVALEWPDVRTKAIHIDIEDRTPEAVAQALIEEILEGGPEAEVILSADLSRLVPKIVETAWDVREPATSLMFPAHPVIVATGGARGVTAACLLEFTRELGKTIQPRWVLLGRTPLVDEAPFTRVCADNASLRNALLNASRAEGKPLSPIALKARADEILAAREVRETIGALKRAGAEARYFAVDARDSNVVGAALAEVRREWGPVHGLIHAAGVLADKLITDLTREQFESVFSTKVEGLRVLLDQTAQDPISMIALFSSVAARYGNRGQAAYAMANEVLNRVAETEAQRRGSSCIVRSINWGPWEGGMVTPALAKHFAEMDVPLIGTAAGAHAFVRELLSGGAQVEVVIGGPIVKPPEDLRIHIRNATHPHLDHHRIHDVPVLPLVEAVGLMLRGAAQGRPGQLPYCGDVKVLRGIRLDGFNNGGTFLTVRQRSENSFELISPDGTRHYEATLLSPADVAVSPPDPGPLSPAPWKESEIYDELLFHGPEFRVIHTIEGVSEKGIAGTLRARNGQRWRHGEGGYDPGMLDGGLQLARLWGFLKLGQPTLPMRVGSIRVFADSDQDSGGAPIECRISASAGTNRIVCDISFYSVQKNLLAMMTGVEMYALNGL